MSKISLGFWPVRRKDSRKVVKQHRLYRGINEREIGQVHYLLWDPSRPESVHPKSQVVLGGLLGTGGGDALSKRASNLFVPGKPSEKYHSSQMLRSISDGAIFFLQISPLVIKVKQGSSSLGVDGDGDSPYLDGAQIGIGQLMESHRSRMTLSSDPIPSPLKVFPTLLTFSAKLIYKATFSPLPSSRYL